MEVNLKKEPGHEHKFTWINELPIVLRVLDDPHLTQDREIAMKFELARMAKAADMALDFATIIKGLLTAVNFMRRHVTPETEAMHVETMAAIDKLINELNTKSMFKKQDES